MFSTLSSYLPSSFQPSDHHKTPPITSVHGHDPDTTLTQEQDDDASHAVSSRPAPQERKVSDTDTEAVVEQPVIDDLLKTGEERPRRFGALLTEDNMD